MTAIAQKMKLSIKNFFCKCDQMRRETVNLFTFTEEILNGFFSETTSF